jgi:hypothetical protein
MNPFKKPPQERLLANRLRDFRTAVHAAAKEFDVPDRAMIAVLEDVVLNSKVAIACTSTPPGSSTRPKFYSGNIPEPRRPLRDLARRIAGLPDAA